MGGKGIAIELCIVERSTLGPGYRYSHGLFPLYKRSRSRWCFTGCCRDLIAGGAAFRASCHSAAQWPPTLCGRWRISKDSAAQAISAACSWAFVRSSSGSAGQCADKRGFCLSCPLKRHVLLYHLTAYCHRGGEAWEDGKANGEMWKGERQKRRCTGRRKRGRKAIN